MSLNFEWREGLGIKFMTCEIFCGKENSSKTLQLLKLISLLFPPKILPNYFHKREF